jgi:hypothetical protein
MHSILLFVFPRRGLCFVFTFFNTLSCAPLINLLLLAGFGRHLGTASLPAGGLFLSFVFTYFACSDWGFFIPCVGFLGNIGHVLRLAAALGILFGLLGNTFLSGF